MSEGNVIAFSGRHGVSALAGTNNAFLRNSIFSNVGLGIDLGANGVTTNDPGDVDAGANDLQNFPILLAAHNVGVGTRIQGTLQGRSNTLFMIEFFAADACHASGNGEGRTYLDSTTTMTDGSGNAAFVLNHPVPLPLGRILTATATDARNNTSEFSPCATVVPGTNGFALAIYSVGASNVLSWTASASSFLLERTTNLSPPIVWTAISNGFVTNGASRVLVLTNNPALPAQFFRLRSD